VVEGEKEGAEAATKEVTTNPATPKETDKPPASSDVVNPSSNSILYASDKNYENVPSPSNDDAERRADLNRFVRESVLLKNFNIHPASPAFHSIYEGKGDNSPTEKIAVDHSSNGELTLHLNFGSDMDAVRSAISPRAFDTLVKHTVDEEVSHLADYVGLRQQWEASDQELNYAHFVQDSARRTLGEMIKAGSKSDALADAVQNLYFEPKKFSGGISDLARRARA